MSSFAVPQSTSSRHHDTDVPVFSSSPEDSSSKAFTLKTYARRASNAIVGTKPSVSLTEDEKFQKLRPRVPSDYTITAEADGMFHGVVNDGGTSKLSVGRYPTHEQAETVCRSLSPPVWETSNSCNICSATFAVIRPRHHCRNCGSSVCFQCSLKAWPSRCLPRWGFTGDVRVCDTCHILASQFTGALTTGDVDAVVTLALTGNVNLTCPLWPGREYPIHVLALNGRLDVLKTLTSPPFYTPLHYTRMGKTYPYSTISKGGRGSQTCMEIAGGKEDIDMVRWLAVVKGCDVRVIRDLGVLHQLLKTTLMEGTTGTGRNIEERASIEYVMASVIGPPVYEGEEEGEGCGDGTAVQATVVDG